MSISFQSSTYPATTNFRSHNNSPINRTLKTNGHELKDNVNIDLNSGNTLTLISDLRVKPAVYVGTISLNSGTFDISSKEMTAYIFESSSSNEPRSLIADGATINCIQAFAPTLSHIPANNLNIIFDQTTIKLGNWNIGELLNGGGLSSNNINYTGAEIYFNSLDFIVGVINGTDNIFEKVEFKKGGTIKGDNSFKNLIFNEGNTYLLEAGKTQIIKAGGSFQASGVSGQPISIESSSDGNLAFLNSEEPICLDYIEMRDIKGTYVAPNPILTHALVAGENSVNGSNNEGWAFTNCIPDTIFSCVGEEILFNQIPSPCLTSWNFGDNTTIIAQNPTHTYNNSGSYYVKVSFNTPCGLIGHDPVDEPSTDSRNYIVVVKPSCCDTLDFPGYRTVEGIISSDEVWGDKIYVTGNIQVRYGAKLDITNADVIFSNGARIGVAENSSLVATNSTFRPCDVNETWTDIVFIQNSTGKLNNNIFINAKSGINIQTSNSVDIIGNQFTNFFNAIIINPGQTNSNLDHLITNNDFTINRDFVNIKNIPSNIYGIKVNGINLKPSISLNEFHYSYLSEDLIRSYGIHITNSTTNASDNKFVNLLYPYYQSNNSGISSFENNEINYNNSFNSDYFSTSLVAGITIENCHNLSTITNNTVISSDVLDQSYGIYVNNATNTLISDNSIKKFYDGILLSGVQQSQINNNNLEQSLSRGVIVVDCFNNVAISSNIITNIPNGFQGIGIMYITNIVGTSATVSIEGNCILNTSMPIDLTNSTTNCLQLPSIHNNYLYNYSSIGVRSSQFSGNIGSSSSHGKNSFVSNTNAFDFYNLTTSCTVNLQGNWPIEVKTDNGLIHQVVVDNSTSSCGRQVKQLRRIGSEGEAHLNFTYGLTFSNANSNYSSGTFELLNTFEDSETFRSNPKYTSIK